MSLDEQFEAVQELIKTLTKRLTDEELFKIYSLFKQATIEKPGLYDLKGKAKWLSWNSKKDVSTEDAKREYIETVNDLKRKYK